MVEDRSLWRSLDVGFHFERNFRFKKNFLERWFFFVGDRSSSADADHYSATSPIPPDSSSTSRIDDDKDDDDDLFRRQMNFRFAAPNSLDLCNAIESLVKMGRDRIFGVSVDFRGWGSKDEVESVVNSLPWLVAEPAAGLSRIEIICDPETASVINAIDFVEQLFKVTCYDLTAANPCLTLQGC